MDVQIENLEKLTKVANNIINIVSPAVSGSLTYKQNDFPQIDLHYLEYKSSYNERSITQMTTLKQTFIPVREANNWKALQKSFEKEKHKANISKDKLNTVFKELAFSIAQLPFEKSSVEITSSNSIKFTVAFPEDILLIISKPFEKLEDVSEDDIIYSLFKNRKRIASNVSKPTEIVEGCKKFLSV